MLQVIQELRQHCRVEALEEVRLIRDKKTGRYVYMHMMVILTSVHQVCRGDSRLLNLVASQKPGNFWKNITQL